MTPPLTRGGKGDGGEAEGWEELALDTAAEGVSDAAVELEPDFFGADSGGGIGEAPVEAVGAAREDGAGFVGGVADGDDEMELLEEVAVEGLALLLPDVYIELGHGFDGERPDEGGIGAG